ncbi:tripartite tricarboxylate transporter TctB family protein [Muricoccus radiodurans]|uniref:tripartite tricarboxylate transporter TctB family protein n=1 Tax=Muricoccus radiodurans TaxID=2231721 RepID=UPI003CEAE2D1
MKLNAKDLWAGGLLILLAVIGLYINGGFLGIGLEQHTLGTARRMGPGYMPMLVFWILLGLGTLVFVLGLNSGPNPLERWEKLDLPILLAGIAVGLIVWQVLLRMGITESYREVGFATLAGLLTISISPSWRPLGTPLASYAIFGLTLEPLGLIVSIISLCVVSSFADREHRPLGVAGMTLFLCVLCWFIFIKQLDIRVPLWPTMLGY